MDRESRIRILLLLAASILTALVLMAMYFVDPVKIYQVIPASSSSTPAVVSQVSQQIVPQEPTENSLSPEENSDAELSEEDLPESEGPQEVLVEKSININTASLEELDSLPGVGPVIAQRIIDYREANNGFYDIQEIMDVSGIGEKTYAKLEPYITVD